MITASLVTFHNSKECIEKIFNCIAQSPISKLYVIDNGADAWVETFCKKYDFALYQKNMNNGYGAGHNIAMRQAIKSNAMFHIVLNPDIYWEEGVISKIATFMTQHDDVGQVMPKVFYPDGQLQYLCKLCPSPIDLIFKRFLPAKWMKKRMDRFQLKFTNYSIPINAPYLSGCFMFFRVDALRKVGLFDERFFMYPEDIDITRRIHREYKTMFYPEVTIIHDHAAASYQSLKMLKIHMINMIRYFNKWGWFWDRERKEMSRKLLTELNYKK